MTVKYRPIRTKAQHRAEALRKAWQTRKRIAAARRFDAAMAAVDRMPRETYTTNELAEMFMKNVEPNDQTH